jgi:hypothetical protein
VTKISLNTYNKNIYEVFKKYFTNVFKVAVRAGGSGD